MSHVIQYHKLPKNASKKNFIADMNEIVQHEDYLEGGSYQASQLTWHDDKVYDSYDDAKQAIDGFIRDSYDDHAVLYYDTDSIAIKPSKTLETAKMKLDKLITERDKYVNENRVSHRSSEFIGCTECGSKVNREYLKSDYCPVCKHDLRSKSTLNRIASFDKRINTARTEVSKIEHALKLKNIKKAKVCWLVKTEYHC